MYDINKIDLGNALNLPNENYSNRYNNHSQLLEPLNNRLKIPMFWIKSYFASGVLIWLVQYLVRLDPHFEG